MFGRWWVNNIKLDILEDVRNGVYRVQLSESGIYVRSFANTMISKKIQPNFMTFLATTNFRSVICYQILECVH